MVDFIKPELDLFQFPPVQNQIIKGNWVDVYPSSQHLNTGPLEFEIVANDSDFLDLNDTILYIHASIVAGNGNALSSESGKKEEAAFVNLALYSMFSDVMVYMNGDRVDGGDQLYPYKAMLTNLFSYSSTTLSQQMICSGYAKDTPGKMDNADNAGHTARLGWASGREYIGRLLNDVCQQERLIVPGVNVKIKLVRNSPEFALMTNALAATAKAKFQINSARLSVRRVKLNPDLELEYEKTLGKGINAIYPYPQKYISVFPVLQGSKTFVKENLFNGKTPKLLIIYMVPTDAYNGSYSKNPYNFVHSNTVLVSLKRDSENIPFQPYEPKFADNAGIYMREFMSLYVNCNLIGREENLPFTYEDYPKGYTFFVFNLTPDLSSNSSITQEGNANLRLELKFEPALMEGVTLMAFAIFPGQLQIDQEKKAYIINPV